MRFRQFAWLIALVAILAISWPAITKAQSIVTGAVSGTVTDPTGAVVPNASVTLKNIATGETAKVATSSTGLYLFALLKPASYVLTVQQRGFKQVSTPVEVLVGQTLTANIKLEIGAATETVEVTAEGALLQTEDANISATVEQRVVEKVPNPGGDLTYMANFTPGVQMNTQSLFGYGNFSAFGLPGTANLFTINGNDYNCPFLNLNNSGSSNLLLGANEVQEVTVVVNGYTGQYGRQAGAQIDYTTLSGTNGLHGDAIYYWNGRMLNADDYFLKNSGGPRPFENNNQWAARVGGPIKKDKAWFFADQEGLRYIFGTSNTVLLPTPAFQSFVLSNIPAAQVPFYTNIFNLYNGTPGISRAAPTAGSCGGLASFTPPGGASQTDCVQTFATSSSNGNREWRLSIRGDYNYNQNNKFSSRWTIDKGVQPTWTDPINRAFNLTSTQPQWDAQVNWTHLFSPSVINNFIASNVYYSAIFQSPNGALALATFPYNMLFIDSSFTTLGQGGANGNFFPQGRRSMQYQFTDDLSVMHGSHAFKMGVAFRRNDLSDFNAEAFGFPEALETISDFAAGRATVASQSFFLSPSQPLAYYSLGLYFQDEYRVNNKLKLTMTLRADRNSSGICQTDCTHLSVTPFDQLSHSAAIPFSQMITPGRAAILRDVEKVVFQPRFGFAWSPLGQKTVFRGGVGLFTDLYPGVLLDTYTRNFPAVTSFAIVGAPLSGAGSGAALVASCNTAFQTTLNSGGTLANYQAAAAAGGCTNPAVPQLGDLLAKTLNPKYVEWNFEVQHTVGSRTVVSANYVGNRGYDLILSNPYLNAFDAGGFGGLPLTAPDARVGTVEQLTNAGHSMYNGITVAVKQQVFHGFSGQLSYTYSHSLDNVSNGGVSPYSFFSSILTQISPFNPNLGYGSSDNDLRHYLNANYVWDLPFKSSNHILNEIVGGWTVSGTFFWHSAFPFSIIDGPTEGVLAAENASFFGATNATVLPAPNVAVPATCSSAVNAVTAATPCWTAANFTDNGFVGIGRNRFRGTDFFNSDLGLRKEFKYREKLGLTLGGNAYNVFNHPNFFSPGFNTGSSLFGLISSSTNVPTSPYGSFAGAGVSGRLLQLFVKATF